MDRRKRIYYTKAQITEGLVTKGGEWMFTDNTEYIGQYHTYTTGEVFSEATFVEGKSRILIPYVNVQSINQQNGIGIDVAKNFEYDGIKNLTINKSAVPNPSQINPTSDDIKRGWMERYFAKKVNDDIILELSKDDYGKVGTPNGLDSVLWEKFTLRWKITGDISDIITTNQKTIQIKSQDYIGIQTLILDYTEFSQI